MPGKYRPKLSDVSKLSIGLTLWEPINGTFLQAVWAEFVFITLFIFIALGAVCFGCHTEAGTPGPELADPLTCYLTQTRVLSIAAGFGFAIFMTVYMAAAFSGGHLNPAITLAFLITKKVSLVRAVCYWIAQLCGAMLGSGFTKAVDRSGFNASKGATDSLAPGISQASAWLMETILTFGLVITVFAATDQPRAQDTAHLPVLAPFAIGMAVFVAHLVAIPIDGCSINPARSFGPAVVSGSWHNQWIFWVGPFSGAIIAALVYELTFRPWAKRVEGVGARPLPEGPTVALPGYTGVQGLEEPMEPKLGSRHERPTRRDTAQEEVGLDKV
jgi:MIP family channel proteins